MQETETQAVDLRVIFRERVIPVSGNKRRSEKCIGPRTELLVGFGERKI